MIFLLDFSVIKVRDQNHRDFTLANPDTNNIRQNYGYTDQKQQTRHMSRMFKFTGAKKMHMPVMTEISWCVISIESFVKVILFTDS